MALNKVYEGVRVDNEWEEVKADNSIWQPENIEDEIDGVVVQINETKFGKQYRLNNVKNDLDILTPSHKALQKILEKVYIGDYIRIVYKGSKPSGKGNDVEIYSVWRKLVKRVDI